ncbi:MAG: hypothetical protein RL033_8133 [Pseudomonadota bacterium]
MREEPLEPPSAGSAGAPGVPQVVFPPLLPVPGAPVPSSPARPEAPGGGGALEPSPAPAGSADAGAVPSIDAGPTPVPPPPPRPVVVEPPSLLELVGFNGGGPRLGTCQGGIVIGARPTANPNTDGFGQRLTFVEPICGSVTLQAAGAAQAPVEATLTLQRDDVRLSWDATEPMLGPPSTEVPDERVLWVTQPEALCPETAPALVGLSGAYDPAAEDGSVTATIRSVVLECAPLVVAANGSDVTAAAEGHLLISRADSFAASGTANYRSACEGGTVLSQLLIHSGFWLDGFVLGCSSLHGSDLAAP